MPRKKKSKKKRTRRRAAGGAASRGRPRKLAGVSLADLRAEIHRRQADLEKHRDELARALEDLERELGDFGEGPVRRGPGRTHRTRAAGVSAATTVGRRRRGRPPGRKPGGRRGGRGGNKMSLVEALHSTLQGRKMSVSEVSDAVQAAGYKTKSANFRTIVNQALTANPGRFRKVSRGVYTAK